LVSSPTGGLAGGAKGEAVPLYEYRCQACGHEFEALVRGEVGPERCARCGSPSLERLLSLFAVETDGTRQASLKKTRQKALAVERDKAIAHEEYVNKHHD
jgi:putative FmdB family regulatory protein